VLLAHLLLWLPHLALAPHVAGLDPVLHMHGRDPAALHATARRVVTSLQDSFAPTVEHQP
jgi:hypothetical protein